MRRNPRFLLSVNLLDVREVGSGSICLRGFYEYCRLPDKSGPVGVTS
jgi:hypothetical protein